MTPNSQTLFPIPGLNAHNSYFFGLTLIGTSGEANKPTRYTNSRKLHLLRPLNSVCNAIELTDLSVEYLGKRKMRIEAVRDLSFSVISGEIVGFLGPNGAGKSSTLKALMGFVQPSNGSLSIFGDPAGSLEAKRHVGYLPEVALYYPYLTPLETLRLYGTIQGIPADVLKTESHELLALIGLENASNKLNRTLSKGMLQRVGIAQSLLGNPKLLILDEVTSGLDPVGRQELRTILLARREAGATILFSSHELAEVEMLCDRVLVIDKGQLIDERIVTDLKSELQRFSLCYRGDVNLDDLAQSVVWNTDGLVTANFASKHNFLLALSRIYSAKVVLIDVKADEGSIEDYFIETVRRAA